jgi:hypothetical protein
MTSEPKVKIRAVGQDRGIGAVVLDEADELSILAVNPGQVSDNFGQTNYGEFGGIDDRPDARVAKLRAGATVEFSGRERLSKVSNDARGVHVAGRFARGNQKLHCDSLKCSSGNEEAGGANKEDMTPKRWFGPGVAVTSLC